MLTMLTNPFGTARKQSNSPKLTVPVMAWPLIRSAARYPSEVRRKSGKGDKEDETTSATALPAPQQASDIQFTNFKCKYIRNLDPCLGGLKQT